MTTDVTKQEDADVHSHSDPGAAQRRAHRPQARRAAASARGLFDPKQLLKSLPGRAAASSTRG